MDQESEVDDIGINALLNCVYRTEVEECAVYERRIAGVDVQHEAFRILRPRSDRTE